jgi:hypothetical protein
MKTWIRDNGLTLALTSLFLASVIGMSLTGWRANNLLRIEHGAAILSFLTYLHSAAFFSALFENWESEFLQMWAYVMLTAYLFQRGSPESKDPDQAATSPTTAEMRPDSPWPVRAGGLWRHLYAHSLGLSLLVLFLVSFALHWTNSATAARDEAILHHTALPTQMDHVFDPEFWFESFQNWQSEFMSTAVLVVLSIFLRERGSPESKAVDAAHSETAPDRASGDALATGAVEPR